MSCGVAFARCSRGQQRYGPTLVVLLVAACGRCLSLTTFASSLKLGPLQAKRPALSAVGAARSGGESNAGREAEAGETEEPAELLARAAGSGDLPALRELLEAGLAPDAVAGEFPVPPLFRAAQAGHAAVVRELLTAGANPNCQVEGGPSALLAAVESGSEEAVRELLKAGADPQGSPGMDTPVFTAAWEGMLPALQALLEHGAEPDGCSAEGDTPLYVAAQEGDEPMVSLLLDAGASADRARPDGATPLYVAAHEGFDDVARSLLASGASPDRATEDGGTPLIVAAQNGHSLVIGSLVNARVELDRPASNGATPLLMAAQNGHVEAVQMLLECGADPQRRRMDGASALDLALAGGHQAFLVHAWVVLGARDLALNRRSTSIPLRERRAACRKLCSKYAGTGSDQRDCRVDCRVRVDLAHADGGRALRDFADRQLGAKEEVEVYNQELGEKSCKPLVDIGDIEYEDVDLNDNHSITPSELLTVGSLLCIPGVTLERLFADMDTDSNGRITLTEWRKAGEDTVYEYEVDKAVDQAQSAEPTPLPVQTPAQKALQELLAEVRAPSFEELDTNGDGFLNEWEMLSGFMKALIQRDPTMSLDVRRSMLEVFQTGLDRLIALIDNDMDGFICPSEYATAKGDNDLGDEVKELADAMNETQGQLFQKLFQQEFQLPQHQQQKAGLPDVYRLHLRPLGLVAGKLQRNIGKRLKSV